MKIRNNSVSNSVNNSVSEMQGKIERYLEANVENMPCLIECCLLNSWDVEEVKVLAEADAGLKRAVRNLKYRRVVNLVKGGLHGDLNKQMVVYMLEQEERENAKNHSFEMLAKLDGILLKDEVKAGKYGEAELA